MQKVIKDESPCYELHKIDVNVTNPFNKDGEFRIVTVETMVNPEDVNDG